MPVRHGDLGCQHRGGAVVPVVDHFHQVQPLSRGQFGHGPVVDDQHLQASQTAQDAGQRAVQPGGCQIVEQARQPGVEDAVTFPGGLIAQ